MKLDPKKTALLTLDFQKGIFESVPSSECIVPEASEAVDCARKCEFQLIHVGLGFSEGHPEVPEFDSPFKRAKQANLFVKGSPSAEFHNAIVRPGEYIVYKQRIGAFSENQLHLVLRARGIENLVLLGISTGGIVLSTLRRAFDLDFRCTVLKDGCFDSDSEVHRVLTEKVFPRQATVTTIADFIKDTCTKQDCGTGIA
jgi:nicotinamidase-related amidase